MAPLSGYTAWHFTEYDPYPEPRVVVNAVLAKQLRREAKAARNREVIRSIACSQGTKALSEIRERREFPRIVGSRRTQAQRREH